MTIENYITREAMFEELRNREIDVSVFGNEHMSIFRYAALIDAHSNNEGYNPNFGQNFSYLEHFKNF